MARWLVSILDPIRNVMILHCVDDIFERADTIGNVSLAPHNMYSIDVDSLHTDIPLHQTVDYLCSFVTSKVLFPLLFDHLVSYYIMHSKYSVVLWRQRTRTNRQCSDGQSTGTNTSPYILITDGEGAALVLCKRCADNILIFADPKMNSQGFEILSFSLRRGSR